MSKINNDSNLNINEKNINENQKENLINNNNTTNNNDDNIKVLISDNKIKNIEDNEEQEVDIEDLDDNDQNSNHNRTSQEDNDDLNQDQPNSSNRLNETNFQIQFSRKSKYNFKLNENLLYQDVIQVNCNSIVADLHKKKFGSGGKGRCIKLFVDREDESKALPLNSLHASSSGKKAEKWFTPIEFETFCGKSNCRDWKRTIKVGGQPLLALLDARILICHAVSCSCGICNMNDSLVGPIRPFMKYRRRNRDEILAQNAYKKFLSLKPPTLLADTLNKNANFSSSGLINNQLSPTSSSSNINSPSTSAINNVLNINTSASPSSIPTSTNNLLQPPALHLNPLNSSFNNTLLTNTSIYALNNSIMHNENSTSSNSNDMTNFIYTSSTSYGSNEYDLLKFMRKMQENDERKWSNLEQITNDLIIQAKNLQTSIENARQESELNWKLLIEKVFPAANSTKRNSLNGDTNLTNSQNKSNKRKISVSSNQQKRAIELDYETDINLNEDSDEA